MSLIMLLLPFAPGACFERAKPTAEDAARPEQGVRVALVSSAESRFYAGAVRPRRQGDIQTDPLPPPSMP